MRRKNKRKKSFGKIIIFFVVGLFLECSILYYINDFVLAKRDVVSSVNFKQEVYEDNKNKKNQYIEFNCTGKNIKCSYNGDYISYIENRSLKIVDVNSRETKKIYTPDIGKISYYRWVPNTSRVYICLKKTFRNSSEFNFFFYDINRQKLNKVKHQEKEVKIVANKDVEIKDIKLSNLTGMFLIKSIDSKGKNSLYKLDRMNNISKLINYNDIGSIALVLNRDSAIYETLPSNKIYMIEQGRKNKLNIGIYRKLTLLGTDKQDNLYLGEVVDKKIAKVYYKPLDDLDKSYADWNEIGCPLPVDKKDIYLIDKQKIYINDSSNNTLINIINNNKIEYKGDLVGVYEPTIISKVNEKIIMKNI